MKAKLYIGTERTWPDEWPLPNIGDVIVGMKTSKREVHPQIVTGFTWQLDPPCVFIMTKTANVAELTEKILS